MGSRLVLPLCLAAATAACGARGDPRPPLRIVPATITLEATRLGDRVYVEFTAPDQDSEGTTPGDIERIEVYALTTQPTVERPREPFSDDWLEVAMLIADLRVRIPDAPPAEADVETSARQGVASEPGAAERPVASFEVVQGEEVTVVEWLTPEAFVPVTVGDPEDEEDEEDETGQMAPMPFVPPPFRDPEIRSYVAFGISSRGRMGDPSELADVPLVAPPRPPTPPVVSYDEGAIEVAWDEPPTFRLPIQADETGETDETDGTDETEETQETEEAAPPVLESAPILEGLRPSGYVVYDLITSGDPDIERPLRLAAPGRTAEHNDAAVEFGATRCYVVRVIDYVGELEILGDASPATCVVLTDTFAPEAPTGLIAVADTDAISLVWDENVEDDAAGYVILRGTAADATLQPLFVEPLTETAYQDTDVTPGERYVYQVRALDTATPPNLSPPSEPVTETAR